MRLSSLNNNVPIIKEPAGVAMSETNLTTRAVFMPETVDSKERTVDVVWTTGARVARNGMDGPYFEELSLSPDSIRMDRLNAGAPLLNSHSAQNLSDVVGVVERAWIDEERNEGRATVRFSQREAVNDIFRDVETGVLRNISVGYRVWKNERVEEDGNVILRAVDWEPHELSLVPIPADSSAQVRAELSAVENTEPEKDNLKMDEIREEVTLSAPEAPEAVEEKRSVTADEFEAVLAAERRRVAEIRRSVRAAGFEDDLADKLAEDGTPIDQARALIIDKMAEREAAAPTRTHVQITKDETEKRSACMEAALEARTGLRDWDDQAREYVGSSLMEMGKECLKRAGVNTTGMGRSELAGRAMHSTSDFPLLLSNIARKNLKAAYAEEQQTFQPLVRQRNLPDFKAAYELEIAGQIIPEPLLEGGEYKAATVQEQQSSWRIYTYGKKISVTRQLLINDDLDSLSRIPAMIGRGMSLFESNQVWSLITGNATLSYDNKGLFHADHANIGTGAIGEASISAARKALRTQSDIAGNRVNLTPSFLIVPAALETAAQKFLTGVSPTATADVNIFSNSMGLIVEPRLDDDSEQKFYVAANTNQIDMIAVGSLEGEAGPQVETVNERDPDGVTIYARLDFGTTLLNHRGFYRSTGV